MSLEEPETLTGRPGSSSVEGCCFSPRQTPAVLSIPPAPVINMFIASRLCCVLRAWSSWHQERTWRGRLRRTEGAPSAIETWLQANPAVDPVGVRLRAETTRLLAPTLRGRSG